MVCLLLILDTYYVLRLYLRTSTPVTPVTQVRIRAIPIIRILPEYSVPGRTLVRRSAYCYFLTLVTRSILQLVIVLSFYYCFIITIRTQVYKLCTLYHIPQFKYQLGLSLYSLSVSVPLTKVLTQAFTLSLTVISYCYQLTLLITLSNLFSPTYSKSL